MKRKFSRRIISAALTLCLVLALLPTSIFADSESTVAEITDSGLTVEYFTSTLYNWDEDAANAATAEADKSDSSTVSWSSTTVSYSQQGNYSTYASGSYYYLYNGEYIQVTSLSASRGTGQNQNTITWTINGTYTATTTQQQGPTSSNSGLTLYSQSTSTSYEGKGFYFTNGSNMASTVPTFSKWLDNAQNYMIYSGLAASKLSDSSNAPFNDETVNAANLFASSDNDYTKVYSNVSVPFVYDEESGYYTLDSDQWAVYFEDGTASSNSTLAIADKPAAHSYTGVSGYSYATGFLPFDDLTNTTRTAVKSGSSGSTTGYQTSSTTWGFGMVTSVDFQMTDDGKDEDGNAITFEFSGDDDVWVYIDGVLVLDIGGTHDAITGTIDFSTGNVTLTSCYDAGIGDLSGKTSVNDVELDSTLSQTNLYTALGTTLTGFASQGSHTLTIYYMERGRGRSNCLIKFNLPQKDSVSVTKTIDEYYTNSEYEISDDVMSTLNNIDFTFTLYNGENVVANKSYSLYDADGNFVSTGSTDTAGTFTLKNGYTATFKNISLDEESSYYVVETSPGDRWTASWSATSSVSNATTTDSSDETGLTSDTVTVTGSSTATDTISFVCENSYSYGSVQPDVDVNNDTIVLDYGLPVEVDVLANDNVTAYGVAVDSTMTLVGADGDGKVTGTYGYATITDDETIVYTLTEDFCGIETFQYTVSASATNTETGEEETQSATATLTIIPATSVYYEENFGGTYEYGDDGKVTGTSEGSLVSIYTKNATFTAISDSETYGTYQETGFVGTTTDSTYGTDAVYLNNLGDSYGTSLYADTTNGAASYTYSFTGTGTTIYGRVNKNTGYICVTITDSNGDVVETEYIDTINLVTSDEDGQILDETLYNIPIYQNTALDSGYDIYTVEVYVYKAGKFHTGNSDFYLDGVRVYNPMGTSTEDNTGYTTAASAYATDGEANTAVVNIREKVVADYENEYSGDEIFTLTDVDGNILGVNDYNDIGPNQEFYLEEGYNLSFALVNWDSQSYKIYLGLKAPNGTASKITVGSGTISVGNSADCYYDISDYVEVETLPNGTVVGYVNIEGVSGLTALTNIKVTGVDKFDLAYNEDYDEVNENEGENSDAEAVNATLYMVSTAYAASLSEEDEEEEVEVFTPESITTSCSYGSKTMKATVTVLTSRDVSYVTINGEKATQKTASGKYRFTASFTKVAAGTTYEIVCYNADGVASQVYTVTAD